MTTTIEIRPTLTEADRNGSAVALASAFYDDPVTKWIVPDGDNPANRR